jgi:hypothetical protein
MVTPTVENSKPRSARPCQLQHLVGQRLANSVSFKERPALEVRRRWHPGNGGCYGREVGVKRDFWFRSNDTTSDFGMPKPPATTADLAGTEAHIGYRLPEELRELLMIQDGGVSQYSFAVDGGRCYPVPAILRANGTGFGTIRGAYDFGDDGRVPAGVVVIATGGHDWLGLDYRKRADRPSVVYQEDEDAEIEEVAESFAQFLGMLSED